MKEILARRRAVGRLLLLLMVLVLLALQLAAQREEEKYSYFFYLSDKRIITVELLSETRTILNYINFSDVVEVLEPSALLVEDRAGNDYRGHVFRLEEPSPEGAIYGVSELVRPQQFVGYDILGNFRLQAPAARVFLRLGGKIVELEPLSDDDFELMADKIGQLDLTVEPTLAISEAGFWQGYGHLYWLGSEEAEAIEARMPRTDLVAPIVTKNPPPRLTGRFTSFPDPVVVRLTLKVTGKGGVVDIAVEEAPDPALGDQAIETVRNSWEFLPAIAEGRPADAELVVQVVFAR